MNKEERVKAYGSFLYCPVHNNLCAGMKHSKDGNCTYPTCIVEDPAYQEKERRKEEKLRNRNKHNRPESEPAPLYKKQPTTSYEQIIIREIEKSQEEMNRCYTKGWTKKADRISIDIRNLEKALEVYRSEKK